MKGKIFLIFIVIFVVIAAFNVSSKDYFSESHPILNEIRRRFKLISPYYANIPLRIGRKSYTEDKTVITICVQNPRTGQFYDIDVLMYVALHELSHCLTKADGAMSHADEFKFNFANLLKEAAEKGVYDPRKSVPTDYCGIEHEHI